MHIDATGHACELQKTKWRVRQPDRKGLSPRSSADDAYGGGDDESDKNDGDDHGYADLLAIVCRICPQNETTTDARADALC